MSGSIVTATTPFQTDPDREIQVLDPYDTEALSSLSGEPLVDSPSNDSVFPAELVKTAVNDLKLSKVLSDTGMTLSQYTSKVNNLLPTNVNLTTMLRSLSITDIELNYNRLLAEVGGNILSGKDTNFITAVLSNISGFSDVVNLDKYVEQVCSNVNTTGAGSDDVVGASMALGNITASLNCSAILGIADRVDALGIPGLSNYILGVNDVGYRDVEDISNISKNYDPSNTSAAIGVLTDYTSDANSPYLDTLSTIPSVEEVTFTNLRTVKYTDCTSCITLAENSDIQLIQTLAELFLLMDAYPSGVLLADINDFTLNTVKAIHVELSKLDIVAAVAFTAALIAAGSTTAWVAANPTVTTYDGLIGVIDSIPVALDDVDRIVNNASLMITGEAIEIINVIDSVSVADSNILMTLCNENSFSTIVSLLSDIQSVGVESIKAILNVAVNDTGLVQMAKLNSAVEALSLESVISLNRIYSDNDAAKLLTISSGVLTLPSEDLDALLNVIKAVDIYAILTTTPLNDDILNISILKALTLAAKAGRVDSVNSLIHVSKITLNTFQRNILVYEVISNYVIDPDLGTRDPYVKSTELLDQLLILSPTFLEVDRAGTLVNNQGIFTSATTDLIFILKHEPRTRVHIACIR